MATSGWLRLKPTTVTTSPPNLHHSINFKLRACFIEYPLASKIIVRNLSYTTSENSLKEEFSNFGHIAEVKLVKDRGSNKSKGFAFVQYTNQDDAMTALETMDQNYLDGRVVFVELAKPRDKKIAYPITSGPPEGSTDSAQKQAQD